MASDRRRLVVVSNRGPIVYASSADGRSARRGGGGLVTALSGLVAENDVTWVATAISEEDRVVAAERGGSAVERDRAGNEFRLRLVEVDRADYDRYYNVFANPLLWFIQHALWDRPYQPEVNAGTRAAWEAYQRVNAALAGAAAEEAGPADAVLVHDYQLYLAPRLIRAAGHAGPLSHFTHIPWPGPESWRILPADVRLALIEGMLGADVVGFQSGSSARAFLSSVEEFLPLAAVDHARLRVEVRDEATHVRAYPISVDPAEFAALGESPDVLAEEQAIVRDRPERLILRVDRTDPSKNVVRGFRAFARFLATHPEWRRRVVMLALLDPSRQEIPEYAEYLGAIHRAAREVNDEFSGDGWDPIDLRVHDNFSGAVAAYKHYDVLLVNAIVDGMNLIAKEAPLVNERDGVLILSETAGAHEELGAFALSVNPFDVEGTAAAIAEALELPPADRQARAEAIRAQVSTHDVRVWIAAQLADLDRLVPGGRAA